MEPCVGENEQRIRKVICSARNKDLDHLPERLSGETGLVKSVLKVLFIRLLVAAICAEIRCGVVVRSPWRGAHKVFVTGFGDVSLLLGRRYRLCLSVCVTFCHIDCL